MWNLLHSETLYEKRFSTFTKLFDYKHSPNPFTTNIHHTLEKRTPHVFVAIKYETTCRENSLMRPHRLVG